LRENVNKGGQSAEVDSDQQVIMFYSDGKHLNKIDFISLGTQTQN
jgi:hypothetical protein